MQHNALVQFYDLFKRLVLQTGVNILSPRHTKNLINKTQEEDSGKIQLHQKNDGADRTIAEINDELGAKRIDHNYNHFP